METPRCTVWQGQEHECIERLLELSPGSVRVKNRKGLYPFQIACKRSRPSPNVTKALLKGFPRAAELGILSFGAIRNSLLAILVFDRRVISHDSVAVILDTCPWTVAFDDDSVFSLDRGSILPSGDALDYASVNFLEAVFSGFHIDEFVPEWYDFEESAPYLYYLEWNTTFLSVERDSEDDEMSINPFEDPDTLREADHSFETVLLILQKMYAKAPFLSLHAAVNGCACRPYHLVMIRKLLIRFGEQASAKDYNGNLPLHLYLESCMLDMDRAIARGYIRDIDGYRVAVRTCFQMIFDANTDAAKTTNGEDRLPLHLAIQNCPFNFDGIIAPLLKHAPESLRARDIKNRLYPFAAAAIGPSANLDAIFRLLQKDPAAVNRFPKMANRQIACDDPTLSGRKRPREA